MTYREEVAKEILLKMIDNPGQPEEKVHAAVRYADMLITSLKRTENGQKAENGNSTARNRS